MLQDGGSWKKKSKKFLQFIQEIFIKAQLFLLVFHISAHFDDNCLDHQEDHHKRLKHVKTVDKSAPFIPDDVEIYFYGGPEAVSKSAPLPSLSKIKYASSSLKR